MACCACSRTACSASVDLVLQVIGVENRLGVQLLKQRVAFRRIQHILGLVHAELMERRMIASFSSRTS